jgi:hypothetical protein
MMETSLSDCLQDGKKSNLSKGCVFIPNLAYAMIFPIHEIKILHVSFSVNQKHSGNKLKKNPPEEFILL